MKMKSIMTLAVFTISFSCAHTVHQTPKPRSLACHPSLPTHIDIKSAPALMLSPLHENGNEVGPFQLGMDTTATIAAAMAQPPGSCDCSLSNARQKNEQPEITITCKTKIPGTDTPYVLNAFVSNVNNKNQLMHIILLASEIASQPIEDWKKNAKALLEFSLQPITQAQKSIRLHLIEELQITPIREYSVFPKEERRQQIQMDIEKRIHEKTKHIPIVNLIPTSAPVSSEDKPFTLSATSKNSRLSMTFDEFLTLDLSDITN